MKTLDFSIVIVSYNTSSILKECIESVIKYTKNISYEIIVVDNGSTDDSVSMVKKMAQKYNFVSVIDTGKNAGFGIANNLGAKQARGEYLLFLNSDTLFLNNALLEVKKSLELKKDVGAYSCQLLNKDKTIQNSGGYFPTLFNFLAWQLFIDDLPVLMDHIKSFHPNQKFYKKHLDLDWVTGAFMVVPATVFKASKGFDEHIFMYTEEMELCYRISKLGYKTYLENTPQIIHLGGASGGSVLAITSEIKYMIYFWKKHMPAWQLPIIKVASFIGSLLRLIIFGIIKRDEKATRAYRAALRHSL